MNIFEESIKWKDKTEEIFIGLHKKAYIAILSTSIIYYLSTFLNLASYTDPKEFYYRLSVACGQILLSSILIFIVHKIEKKKSCDLAFFVLAIYYDLITIFIGISVRDEDAKFIRFLYHLMCYTVMFVNTKSNHTIPQFLGYFAFKLIAFGVFLYFYNFQVHKSYLFIDLYMILLSFAMIIMNMIIKRELMQSLEKEHLKNVALSIKLGNIFNSIKSPLISINFKKFTILFNTSFIKFLNEEFCDEIYQTKYLFGDSYGKFTKEDHEFIIKDDVSSMEKIFLKRLDELTKSEKEKKIEKIFLFERRLVILKKIFKNFSTEKHLESQGKVEFLSIFDIFSNKKIFEENEYFEYKGEYKVGHDSEEKILEVSWRRTVYNQKEEVYDIMLNDITAIRESELTKADMKYRKIYLAKIAHEFKTPINSLIYSVKEIVENNSLKQTLSEKLSFIEGQANFISILIHDINDYCKDIKEFEVNLESVEIKTLISFAFQILHCLVNRDPIKKENIVLSFNISENVPKFICTDEKRIKQLLVNLISNSVKFTHTGFIKISVEFLEESNPGTNNLVKFSVEDSGIGIKKDEQVNLFKEFSEINREYFNLNKHGSGLGLSICKKIVEKLGKTISCESENNKTQFMFTLYDFQKNVDQIIAEDEEPKFVSVFPEEATNLMRSGPFKDDDIQLIIDCEHSSCQSNTISLNNSLMSPRIDKRQNSVKKDEIIVIEPASSKLERKFVALLENPLMKKSKLNLLYFSKQILKYLKNIVDFEFLLIADDEMMNQKSLKCLLKRYYSEKGIKNVKVLTLNDGIEVLNLLYFDTLYYNKISVVISDLNMKFLNGNDLCEIIKKINAFNKIKFVYYTNMDVKAFSKSKDEINYYLDKPCAKIDVEKMYSEFLFRK